GAPRRTDGPPPTLRIGDYFTVALFGGTAYVAWDGNNFSVPGQPTQQVFFSSFAISGALTLSGTTGNDTIVVRPIAGNPDFLEAIVNGDRQYAGLASALTGITINGRGGNDTITVVNPWGIPVTINRDGDDADGPSVSAGSGGPSAGHNGV